MFVRLSAGYLRWLKPALHHRAAVMVARGRVLRALLLGIVAFLRQEFIPPQDMSRFLVRFQTPVGSSLDATDRVFKQLEAYMESRPEVLKYGGAVGGFGGGEVNTGVVFVTMKDPRRSARSIRSSAAGSPSRSSWARCAQMANSIPGCRANMQDLSQAGFSASRGGGFPVEFNIRGRDWDLLARSAKDIMEEMRQSGTVTDVDSDYQVGMPEVQVVPDRNKAADLGISMAVDRRDRELGDRRPAGRQVQGQGPALRHPGAAARPAAPAARGHPAASRAHRPGRPRAPRATSCASSSAPPSRPSPGATASGPSRSSRTSCPAPPRTTPSTARWPPREGSCPTATAPSPRATARPSRSPSSRCGSPSLSAWSWPTWCWPRSSTPSPIPFTVLLALPFSISGALMALWLAGQSLNVYSMLGMILLMGIAKKNSIMLVDFTNQLREQGAERHDALLEACPLRLRPILMTSIATIAGALPPALAIGPGAELQRPMALALVGGMIVSTAAHPVRGARGLQPARRRGRLERAAARAGRRARGRTVRPPRIAFATRLGVQGLLRSSSRSPARRGSISTVPDPVTTERRWTRRIKGSRTIFLGDLTPAQNNQHARRRRQRFVASSMKGLPFGFIRVATFAPRHER